MDNSSLQFVEESVVSHNANNSVLSELDDILQKCDQSQINSKRKLNKNNNPNNSTTNSRPKSRGADVSLVNSDNEEEKENRADHIPFPSFYHSNNNNNNNTLSDDISPICNERDDVESVHDAQRLNSETMHTNTLPNINENYTNLFNFSDSALETEGLVRSGGSRSPSVHHNTSR
ncbi:hypothetical protein ADEAN_000179100 [Angomonas deanei]|uniref:Uncharacterized protein n=1 Tax=Angomonas deanei TaxID=59799 RepID=A0A7G2C3R1_9TRYP|nr:hypothetical protein ADEAN_000179100 [Angomonas deanei]